MNKDIKCVICPKGCEISVTVGEKGKYIISGHGCEIGKSNIERDILFSARVLTTTVKVKNGIIKRLPVRSDGPLNKNIIFQAMEVIKCIEVEAPVNTGDVLMENILSTGINIIASRNIDDALKS